MDQYQVPCKCFDCTGTMYKYQVPFCHGQRRPTKTHESDDHSKNIYMNKAGWRSKAQFSYGHSPELLAVDVVLGRARNHGPWTTDHALYWYVIYLQQQVTFTKSCPKVESSWSRSRHIVKLLQLPNYFTARSWAGQETMDHGLQTMHSIGMLSICSSKFTSESHVQQ